MTASTTTATKFAVTATRDYSAIAYIRAATTGRSVAVGIRYLNSAGTEISTTYGTAVSDTNSAWVEASASVAAPVLATHAQVFVKVTSAGSGEVHYVDAVAFHAGDEPVYSRGGFSNFKFDVERSDDSGTTYEVIRNSPISSDTTQVAEVNDYEVPLDQTVRYRAKARGDI